MKIKEGKVYYHKKNGVIVVALENSHADSWWLGIRFRRLKGHTTIYLDSNRLNPVEEILPPKDLLVYELSGILPKNIYALVKQKIIDKKLKMSDNTEN